MHIHCLIKHHAMTTYWGGSTNPLILDPDIRWN